MRTILFILSAWLLCPFLLPAQDSRDMPTRTPEQEAARQTEMLRQALNLNEAQERLVYRINLHYARERQASNSRAEAMERVKRKNADLRKVLTDEQYERLQNKHYERSSYRLPGSRSHPGNTIDSPPATRSHTTVRPSTQPNPRPMTHPGSGYTPR